MMNKQFIFLSFFILMAIKSFAAGPFSLARTDRFPTMVYEGHKVVASYIVTNLASKELDNCIVESHPNNVSISSEGCGKQFNLKSKESCTLNLIVSGEVNNLPALFICDSTGTGCTGNGNVPLIVHVNHQVPFLSLTSPNIPSKLIDDHEQVYSYTLNNTGSGSTSAIRISFNGAAGSDALSLVEDQCSGKILSPNQTCTFGVKVSPHESDVNSGIRQMISIDYIDE